MLIESLSCSLAAAPHASQVLLFQEVTRSGLVVLKQTKVLAVMFGAKQKPPGAPVPISARDNTYARALRASPTAESAPFDEGPASNVEEGGNAAAPAPPAPREEEKAAAPPSDMIWEDAAALMSARNDLNNLVSAMKQEARHGWGGRAPSYQDCKKLNRSFSSSAASGDFERDAWEARRSRVDNVDAVDQDEKKEDAARDTTCHSIEDMSVFSHETSFSGRSDGNRSARSKTNVRPSSSLSGMSAKSGNRLMSEEQADEAYRRICGGGRGGASPAPGRSQDGAASSDRSLDAPATAPTPSLAGSQASRLSGVVMVPSRTSTTNMSAYSAAGTELRTGDTFDFSKVNDPDADETSVLSEGLRKLGVKAELRDRMVAKKEEEEQRAKENERQRILEEERQRKVKEKEDEMQKKLEQEEEDAKKEEKRFSLAKLMTRSGTLDKAAYSGSVEPQVSGDEDEDEDEDATEKTPSSEKKRCGTPSSALKLDISSSQGSSRRGGTATGGMPKLSPLRKLKSKKQKSRRFFGKKSAKAEEGDDGASATTIVQEEVTRVCSLPHVHISRTESETEEQVELLYGSVHSLPKQAKKVVDEMPRVGSNRTDGTESITLDPKEECDAHYEDDEMLHEFARVLSEDANDRAATAANDLPIDVAAVGLFERLFTCASSPFQCSAADGGSNGRIPLEQSRENRSAADDGDDDGGDGNAVLNNVECVQDENEVTRIGYFKHTPAAARAAREADAAVAASEAQEPPSGPMEEEEPGTEEGTPDEGSDAEGGSGKGMKVTSKVILKTHAVPGFEVLTKNGKDDFVVDSVSMKIDDIARKLNLQQEGDDSPDGSLKSKRSKLRTKFMKKLNKRKDQASKKNFLDQLEVTHEIEYSSPSSGKDEKGSRRKGQGSPAEANLTEDADLKQVGTSEVDQCCKMACGGGGGDVADEHGDLDVPFAT